MFATMLRFGNLRAEIEVVKPLTRKESRGCWMTSNRLARHGASSTVQGERVRLPGAGGDGFGHFSRSEIF
jgi:hypothetical protein